MQLDIAPKVFLLNQPWRSEKGKKPPQIDDFLWEIRWEGVDWIHVAQDTDQWRAPLNTVMNFRVP
jgi:hypothetical protein